MRGREKKEQVHMKNGNRKRQAFSGKASSLIIKALVHLLDCAYGAQQPSLSVTLIKRNIVTTGEVDDMDSL